jgi:hypothetical protein
MRSSLIGILKSVDPVSICLTDKSQGGLFLKEGGACWIGFRGNKEGRLPMLAEKTQDLGANSLTLMLRVNHQQRFPVSIGTELI